MASGTKIRERPVQVPVLAELIGRGDGTFILRPKLPERDLDTWITIRQAAELLGHVAMKSVYRLLGEYLVYRRPLPSRIVVSLKSVMALRQATQDVEFWHNPVLQKRVKDRVSGAMTALAEEAEGNDPLT